MRSGTVPLDAEWLEADGWGGFASGTVGGPRTRRYHALLLTATTPPTGRMALVNGFEAWVETGSGRYPLSSQRYAPDVVHPDSSAAIESFSIEPWPTWVFALPDGIRIRHEISVSGVDRRVALTWALDSPPPGLDRPQLHVRPLISGRDAHALHHENPVFRFEADLKPEQVVWRPYPGVPGIAARSNGLYRHDPLWYRNFLYEEERARGLDFLEDLASPGVFSFDLAQGEAVWLLEAVPAEAEPPSARTRARVAATRHRARETARRQAFPDRLARAGDAYVVRRGEGRSIVAGYPWFTDWGRDTFIALRGLCLATGRLDEARAILLAWAGSVSEGMLPNRFAEAGDEPEYNSVDASLWYVIATHEYLTRAREAGHRVSSAERRALLAAVEAIVAGYARGTRYGIRMDEDGLLRSGEPGVQLTWMDAKVGDWVVTPRTGKPVEVQALWINALRIASAIDTAWEEPYRRGVASFATKFWNEGAGCLYDVVDVDHAPGSVDGRIRPNQLFAVGGLPYPILNGPRARSVVDVVERELMTPLGPRSLARGEPGYAPRYEGGVLERDGSYHQGTVWPWLIGSFVEAWVRVRGDTEDARREARERFVAPLLGHLDTAGLGHVSEIADAEPPFTPRGCPFQAWSVGELIRAVRATEEKLQPAAGVPGRIATPSS